MLNSYIITGTGKISAFVCGKAFTVGTDHPNYSKILDAIKSADWTSFIKLVDVTTSLNSYFDTTSTGVKVSSGEITYNGKLIHNSLTKRILDFMHDDLPFEPMVKFLGNLLQNPSFRAVNELYDFLEVGELPITEDGCFLAFKNVRSDFKDIYSASVDNSVGQKPEMDRNMVDDDKDNTCSRGYHFCSIKYLPHFSDSNGGHTMIVKINPADVVAIPKDYNNTKGRTCKYEVVAEYMDNWRERVKTETDSGFDAPLYSSMGGTYQDDDCDCCDCDLDDQDNDDDLDNDEPVYGVKSNGQRFYNVRDAKGHFIKG